MKIIAASGLGYERDLEVSVDGMVLYCTTTVFHNYMDIKGVDDALLDSTIKKGSFSIEYATLCPHSDVILEQPIYHSPSTILRGICIETIEDDTFFIDHCVLGAVLVSFENVTELSLGQEVIVRGELHVDSEFII